MSITGIESVNFCAFTHMHCNQPYKFLLFIFLLTGYAGLTQEICNNGIDDDNDGLRNIEKRFVSESTTNTRKIHTRTIINFQSVLIVFFALKDEINQ